MKTKTYRVYFGSLFVKLSATSRKNAQKQAAKQWHLPEGKHHFITVI